MTTQPTAEEVEALIADCPTVVHGSWAHRAKDMLRRLAAVPPREPMIPRLGLATTRQLIDELAARAEVSEINGETWPKYRTVGPEPDAAPQHTPAPLSVPSDARVPDGDMVICPGCTHQFRAVPVNVQAEIANLRNALTDAGEAEAEELNELHAELERLRPDAERYRWLRDVGNETWMPLAKRGFPAMTDAAIDAALREPAQERK